MFPTQASQAQVLDADASIRQTDFDAAGARLSAVQKGYFSDPFIKYFVPRAHLQPPRPPLINVGTYVRSTAIDTLVHQWFSLSAKEGKRCQIVSLGAGSDTRFWRIATGSHNDQLARYVELDFPEVTSKKAMAIRKSKDLSAVLGDPTKVALSNGGTGLHSTRYHLLPVDLRLPPSETLPSLLSSADGSAPLLSPSLPTLLLFECVLVYMSPEASSNLIAWFTEYFSRPPRESTHILGGIVYEMFGLNDAFGRIMHSNMQSRGVSLPGVEPYPTLASLPARFTTPHNFTVAKALTLRDIRKNYISSSELARISTLEMLDEIEELELVLEHYAVTWGLKVYNDALTAPWREWGLVARSTSSETDSDNTE